MAEEWVWTMIAEWITVKWLMKRPSFDGLIIASCSSGIEETNYSQLCWIQYNLEMVTFLFSNSKYICLVPHGLLWLNSAPNDSNGFIW